MVAPAKRILSRALAAWKRGRAERDEDVTLDPRNMRPGEVVRVLNSSPLGPVIVDRQLYRHRARAGFRIGDGRRIDFFRYVAWLFDVRQQAVTDALAAASPEALSRQAAYSRASSLQSADIGPIRAVVDPARREACRFNLELFLTTYFPQTTGLRPFSDDHRRVIARIQGCILNGGREAKAIYRGFAKSTIAENAAIWSQVYGHRRFVALFGANATAATDSINSIKRELEANDLLDEDFPEVTQAIRALQGKPQRCQSQTCEGLPTFIEWTSDKIAFPWILGAASGGAVITAHGLTAAVRGLKHKMPDGTQQRPDLAIVDDPQTDESAGSPAGVRKRISIIRKVILRLAGHQRQIACIVNGTVIEKDDVMDQLTDQRRNPAFQSERIKMVRKWAEAHDTLWMDQYARLRNTYDSQVAGDQERAKQAATDFYEEHREAMDAGGEVSWEWCYDDEAELSALQHAYNILIDDGPEAFASECQSEPMGRDTGEDKPSLSGIGERLNRLKRGIVPIWATKLVAFADVQGKALYYVVMAFADDFTGAIVDYGTVPEQPREYFTLRDLRKTLAAALEAAGKVAAGESTGQEAAIWHGLELLESRIVVRPWKREDGTEMRLDKVLIDSGDWTDTVYEYCRRSAQAGVIMPSKGLAVTAGKMPMTQWQMKPHERPGFHFVITSDMARRAVRLVRYDTYFWKTFIAHRLKTLGPGNISIYGGGPGDRQGAGMHQMLADHLAAEYATWTEGQYGTVWTWSLLPGRDNHLLDGIVGCYTAAAMLGCRLGVNRPAVAPPRSTGPRVRVNLAGPPGTSSFFITNR